MHSHKFTALRRIMSESPFAVAGFARDGKLTSACEGPFRYPRSFFSSRSLGRRLEARAPKDGDGANARWSSSLVTAVYLPAGKRPRPAMVNRNTRFSKNYTQVRR